MLRRPLTYHGSGASSVPRALLLVARSASTDAAELEREQKLREQIQSKYRGMKMPEMTNIVYGKFSGKGVLGQAAQQGNGASQSAFTNWASSASAGSGSSDRKPQSVDWLLFFTGTALVIVTSRLLADRINGPTSNDNLVVPLWCVPFEQQAKYLLYLVSTDKAAKDHLHQEYLQVRASYPLLNYFDWLDARYPHYGAGRVFPKHVAVEMVANMLSTGGQMQLAGLARLASSAVNSATGDPQSRVDAFLTDVEKLGAAGPRRAYGAPGVQPAYGGGPGTPYDGHVQPAPFQQNGQGPVHVPSGQSSYQPTAGFDPLNVRSSVHNPQTYGGGNAPNPLAHGAQQVSLDDVLSSVQGQGSGTAFAETPNAPQPNTPSPSQPTSSNQAQR